jgi:hypothetical protein
MIAKTSSKVLNLLRKRTIALYMVINRKNLLKRAKPSEEANDRYVNGDQSLSRCATLCVRVLQRMDSQPCMSTIDRTIRGINCTWERESRDLLLGHFLPFPHHFPLAPRSSP